ncbi:hypothetical protein [Pseudomonas cannabina]|uniref:hypothetical protein n=1 Tax=Pseudomonas cannabina TaxID=86840 RepID=UPI0011C3C702|nr:hypothetical protein [Pseudomonas cannabina]
MSSKQVTAPIQRLCGHIDLFTFATLKTQRTQDALYAKNTLCKECHAAISKLAAPGKKGFYKMTFPEMKGPGNTKAFGNSIRIKAIRSLGPIMADLSNNESLYGQLALAVYTMLFQIDYAPFWINSRQFQFDTAWLVSEMENLIRTRPSSAVNQDQRSVFVYWTQVDRAKIRTARVALEEVAQHLDLSLAGRKETPISYETVAAPSCS